MKIMRKISKIAAILFALHMLMISGLSQSVWAAMMHTESIINLDRGQSPRNDLNNLLARAEIQALLTSYGIDPQEARDRIDHLSDDEINTFVHEIDQLPAGAGFFETLIIIVFFVFLILLLTDISGHTDVFPFVKKQASKTTPRDETTGETSNIKDIQPAPAEDGINPAETLIIYFNPDSNDLTAKAYESLDQVVQFMAKDPKTNVNIIGFSDSTRSSSYDVMLSESRANSVKNYLIAKGIDPRKISTLGSGSQGFSAIEGSEEERQMVGGVAIEFNTPTAK